MFFWFFVFFDMRNLQKRYKGHKKSLFKLFCSRAFFRSLFYWFSLVSWIPKRPKSLKKRFWKREKFFRHRFGIIFGRFGTSFGGVFWDAFSLKSRPLTPKQEHWDLQGPPGSILEPPGSIFELPGSIFGVLGVLLLSIWSTISTLSLLASLSILASSSPSIQASNWPGGMRGAFE